MPLHTIIIPRKCEQVNVLSGFMMAKMSIFITLDEHTPNLCAPIITLGVHSFYWFVHL